ncbi:hypothetical protein CR513_36275, partial [Mucuna pruriens]
MENHRKVSESRSMLMAGVTSFSADVWGMIFSMRNQLPNLYSRSRPALSIPKMDFGSSTRMVDTLPIKVKIMEYRTLKKLADQLKGGLRRTFETRFGSILELMEVEIHPESLNPPYLYQGNFLSWGRVAKLLKIVESEEIEQEWNRWPPPSLSRRKNEGLAIYDVILLPHLDKYVNLASIDIFLANQERARNPMTSVLANTYYTIYQCHERNGGRLVCCMQALYIWLMTHTSPLLVHHHPSNRGS